ncbi:hypothetical protein Ndes2526A_g01330 [Nannochloris sp. 'desiccata']
MGNTSSPTISPPTPQPSLSPQASVSSEAEGCCLMAEMDRPLDSPCVIFVPNVQALREGSSLVGQIKIGRLLGQGLQARVHELTFKDGTPVGKVVKISHQDIGHKALNAVWIGMEREWELGLKLRVALQDPDTGKLPGFMRVCDALVSGSDPDTATNASTPGQRRKARFAGMVLEKLNGWEVYKRIDMHEFHNIHYVREMLRQVFNALDRAERECGLFHADLGMRNVMEHYPQLYREPQAEQRRKNLVAEQGGPSKQGPAGDDIGPGYEIMTGSLPTRPDTAPSVAETTSSTFDNVDTDNSDLNTYISTPRTRATGGNVVLSGERVDAARIPTEIADLNVSANASVPALTELPDGGGSPPPPPPAGTPATAAPTSSAFRVRPRPGYTCNGDGSRMPLGPQVEFKIIDYGSSYFSETLAQATGGFRARHNYQRLTRLFESKQVAFRSPTRQTLLEVETSNGKAGTAPGKPEKKWRLMPSAGKIRQRFHLKAMKEADANDTSTNGTSTFSTSTFSTSTNGNSTITSIDARPAATILPPEDSANLQEEDSRLAAPVRLHSFRLESPFADVPPSENPPSTETTAAPASPGAATSAREARGRVHHEHSWKRQHLRTLSEDITAAEVKGKEETPLAPPSPTSNIIEILYRHFWRRKGDVFHLLLSLAIALDDRLWPREDKEEVQLFISLVYHVTGVKLKASFASEGEPAAAGLWGARRKLQGKSKKYGSKEAWGSWFRRVHIRLKAHFFPYNSGTTAGQALLAPFFQEKEEPTPPAIGAASLETLFPRSGPIE